MRALRCVRGARRAARGARACGNPSSVHGEGRAARRADRRGARGRSPRWSTPIRATSSSRPAAPRRTRSRCRRDRARQRQGSARPAAGLGRSSIRRCWRAGGFRRAQVEKIPVDADGVIDLAALEQRLGAGGRAARVGDGGEQRNRRGSAGRRRSPRSSTATAVCCTSMPCRRRGGSDSISMTLGADCHDAQRAQDRRREGCRRADPARRGASFRRAADQRRRAGARQPRRHRECRGNRGVRRGGNRDQASSSAAEAEHMAALRDRLEAGLRAATPDAVIFGAKAERLPNTTLVAMPGAKAETLVIALRSRRRRGLVRRGLFVRQGRALARACRHGRACGTRARRDPNQHRPCHHGGRNRPISERLEKACSALIYQGETRPRRLNKHHNRPVWRFGSPQQSAVSPQCGLPNLSHTGTNTTD